ncbi:MAG: CoA transferase [Dehalococcoidia bacterium]|nr:CoA transferase [Dehalococcoidia bacterium]
MADAKSSMGALEGVRVLDLTGPIGVYCGKLLADLGADVIKVEPPEGDPMRSRGPFYKDDAHPEKSLYFFAFNTSKRSVTLGLETADGREVFQRLVQRADILLESFPPGYLEGLDLGYDQLSAVNPGLIMTSITPFGQTGPYKDFKGSDLVVDAMGGLTNLIGNPGERPAWTLAETGYHQVGIQASSATLIALYHKTLTGEGQYIDVSMQQAVAMLVPSAVQAWDMRKEVATRTGGASVRAGFGMFRCKDGYVNMVLRAGPPLNFLCQWLDEDGLEHDFRNPQWHDMTFRSQPENITHLNEVLAPWFLTYTQREIIEKAQSAHLSITPVYDTKQVREDPHLNARGFFIDIEHPELDGSVTYAGAPYGLSDTPWRIHRRPPLIGEHNHEIFVGEMGYTVEQLAVLRANGAI